MSNNTIKHRMGGFLAVAAMFGFLAAFALIALRQIPAENKDFFTTALIALISCVNIAFGYYLGSSQSSARKTELQAKSVEMLPETIDDSQSGSTRVATLVILAMLCMGLIAGSGLTGCAPNQSVTQQMAAQTSDPGTIALAVFADAQDAYIEAVELYRPYQQALRQSNPELDAEIIGCFREANRILDDWELYGDVPAGDKNGFREYLREISIKMAMTLEANE